jgi:hypothetical protein
MTDSPPRRRVSRRLVVLLISVLVVVLAAAGLAGTRIFGLWGDEAEPPAAASPSPEAPSPFAGTPAEAFPEGADGIVLPPAEAVGDFTADQVADALERVRGALIAARLDESLLVGHDPADFLANLAPDLRSALGNAFESEASTTFSTRVAEDTELAPVPPRVTGTISYETTPAGAQDTEVIEITTRFTWVYAFQAADQPTGSDLVTVRDAIVWRMQIGEPWVDESQGLWLLEPASQAWGADCDAYEDGVLRPDDRPAATLAEQGDEIFDPEQPLDAVEGC